MYADDIVLIAETPAELQDLLNTLSIWCSFWKLSINIAKSKVIHFRGRRTRCTEHPIRVNNELLEHVQHYKYL